MTATKLLTLDEAAAYMRVKRETLRTWRANYAHAPKGPRSALIGGRVMYRESDCDAWISAQFGDEPESPPRAGLRAV